jgi:hypothetical protein
VRVFRISSVGEDSDIRIGDIIEAKQRGILKGNLIQPSITRTIFEFELAFHEAEKGNQSEKAILLYIFNCCEDNMHGI